MPRPFVKLSGVTQIYLTAGDFGNTLETSQQSNQEQQMTKTTNLYQVREFTGNEYSKQLGRRLRTRTDALRIVRLLKKAGREVFASPLKIAC